MCSTCTEKDYEVIENLVKKFCGIVLTKKDNLTSADLELAKKYIDGLSSEEIKCLNMDNAEMDPRIRSILLRQLSDYIQSYDEDSKSQKASFKRPFEFNSAGTFTSFRNSCESYYKKKNQGYSFPSVLDFTFRYIEEISEHYRIFVHFYDIRSAQTSAEIVRKMATTAEKKANAAVKNVTETSARKEVKKALDKKMLEVTKQVSETSVTILGIFAGIVLTVVAGLFYSSSVLESIDSANIFKLLSIASLVGLVCICVISVMFRYIEGFRSSKENTSNVSQRCKACYKPTLIMVLLFILVFVFIRLYFKYPDNNITPSSDKINVSVSANIDDLISETGAETEKETIVETELTQPILDGYPAINE